MKKHRVIKGKRESYALLGAKPSGTHQRRVNRHGINRMYKSRDSQPNLFRGITSKAKQDNGK